MQDTYPYLRTSAWRIGLPLKIPLITHKQILTERSFTLDDSINDGLRGRVLHRDNLCHWITSL